MKLSVRQIVTGGVLLALMIISQLFKGLSVYITGPLINAILIIATLSLGLSVGIILSVIAPITSFLITASPIIAGIPLIMAAIMVGNIILCLCAHLAYKRWNFEIKDNSLFSEQVRLVAGLIIGSVLKAGFMGAVIVKCLLPLFSANIKVPAEKLPAVVKTASVTFGITQLFTSLIGSALAIVIWMLAGKALKAAQEQ